MLTIDKHLNIVRIKYKKYKQQKQITINNKLTLTIIDNSTLFIRNNNILKSITLSIIFVAEIIDTNNKNK